MADILDVFDKVVVLNDLACKLESCEVLDFVVDIKKKSVRVELLSPELISNNDLFDFEEQAKNIYDLLDIEIKIKYKNLVFSDEYYRNMLIRLFRGNSICKAFLIGSRGVLDGNVLKIGNVKCGKEILEKNNCAKSIKEIVDYELGMNLIVEIDAEKMDMDEYNSQKENRISEISKKIALQEPARKEKEEEKKPVEEVSTGTVYGKAITEEITPMVELRCGMGICAVRGEVIDVSVREIQKDG